MSFIDEGIWVEDQPMCEKAEEITKILKGMSLRDRAHVILDVMSHDGDLMEVVRGRMNWELRMVVEGSAEKVRKEKFLDVPEKQVDETYGCLLTKEAEDVMRVVFPEELEE